MVIYVVKYQTGYGHDEVVSYHLNKDEAEERAKKVNIDNQGLDVYVTDIEVE